MSRGARLSWSLYLYTTLYIYIYIKYISFALDPQAWGFLSTFVMFLLAHLGIMGAQFRPPPSGSHLNSTVILYLGVSGGHRRKYSRLLEGWKLRVIFLFAFPGEFCFYFAGKNEPAMIALTMFSCYSWEQWDTRLIFNCSD